jgi:hypothetical protein
MPAGESSCTPGSLTIVVDGVTSRKCFYRSKMEMSVSRNTGVIIQCRRHSQEQVWDVTESSTCVIGRHGIRASHDYSCSTSISPHCTTQQFAVLCTPIPESPDSQPHTQRLPPKPGAAHTEFASSHTSTLDYCPT